MGSRRLPQEEKRREEEQIQAGVRLVCYLNVPLHITQVSPLPGHPELCICIIYSTPSPHNNSTLPPEFLMSVIGPPSMQRLGILALTLEGRGKSGEGMEMLAGARSWLA